MIIELYCSADLDVPQMDEIVADQAFSKAEQLLKVQQNIRLRFIVALPEDFSFVPHKCN